MNPQESVPAQAPVSAPAPAPVSSIPLAKIEGPVELLKFGWKLFTGNWKTLTPILLLPTIIINIATLIMYGGNTVAMIIGVIVIIIGCILSVAGIPAVVGAVHRLSTDPTSTISLKEQYRFGFGLFWSYILVAIIGGFAGFGSMVLLVIPGIIFAIYTLTYTYTLIVDNKRGLSAFTESYSLVRGRWWPVLGRVLFLGLVMVVIMIIVAGANFLVVLMFGVTTPAMGSPEEQMPFWAMVATMIVGLISNAVVGLISVGYTYRLFTSLKAVRNTNVETKTFKNWLIAFICIGAVGIVVAFISIPLVAIMAERAVHSKVSDAREASLEAQSQVSQIQADIERMQQEAMDALKTQQ